MRRERDRKLNAGGWRLVLLGVATAAFTGCDAGGALVRVGLADPAPLPSETIDVACDSSLGSTCTIDTLGNTLMVVLGRAAARPGSVVRLWVLGATIDSLKVKAEVSSLPLAGRTARARAAEAARWQVQQREVFMARAAPFISPARPPTSSPLAEAITKIALADSHDLNRKIVLVSDGREMSVASFECGPLPTDEVWAARLKKLGLLAPGSLAGVDIAFTYLTMPPIVGCPVSLKRELRIRELWKIGLTAGGASDVRMLSGPVTWDEHVAVRAAEGGK